MWLCVCLTPWTDHCFGMVMGNLACMTHGSTMVYPSEAFDPDAALTAVANEKCTALYGVPTMFIACLGVCACCSNRMPFCHVSLHSVPCGW